MKKSFKIKLIVMIILSFLLTVTIGTYAEDYDFEGRTVTMGLVLGEDLWEEEYGSYS
jgi:hypothetical protein